MNGQRVHLIGEFRRKHLVDQAMARKPRLAAEGSRYDIDPEMRLPARPMARMAFVLVRFIDNPQA